MAIDKETIEEIVARVTEVVPATKIILFGSAAAGKMTRDSDIDLLVIAREFLDYRAEWLRIRMALRDIKYPFDIILMSEDRFEETKNVIGGIAYPANKEGVVIYEARPSA